MGFSDHTIHNVSLIPESYLSLAKSPKDDGEDDEARAREIESAKLSDQEVLDSTEAIYFAENVDTGIYEMKVGQMPCVVVACDPIIIYFSCCFRNSQRRAESLT